MVEVTTTRVQGAKVDGRRARSERSQAALIEALLELLQQSSEVPSSRQIAELAGVTQRTLFNHFDHLGQLFAAAQAERLSRLAASVRGVDSSTPLVQRVQAFAESFAESLEQNSTVFWVGYTRSADAPEVAAKLDELALMLRSCIEETFPSELDAMDAQRRTDAMAVLELAVSPIGWHLRRDLQGLSADAARSALLSTCRGVFSI